METTDRRPQRWWTAWPHAAAIIAGSVGASVGVFLLFLGLSYASLGADRAKLADRVAEAFAAGDLDPQDSWLHGDTNVGAHQFNDCLILYQTLDARASRRELAVSPMTTPVDTDFACARLQRLVAGSAAAPRFYHQYLHAHTTLARLLVPDLGVRGTREFYKLLVSLGVLAGLAYAVIGLTRGRRSDENALWLVLFAVFARWFGFEAFGQSLGHGPADLMLLGFMLFVSRASATAPIGGWTAIVAAALFGALTMQFEFLTGGLPLGLAMVIGITPLALRYDERAGSTVIAAAFAYLTAAAVTVIQKFALVMLIFGAAPILDTGRQLLFRTGISHAPNRDQPADWATFFGHVWAGLDALAPGMHWLTLGVLVLSVVAGLWGYRRMRSAPGPSDRLRSVALLGSNIVPLMWMAVFWQHTAQHAWFMDRLLVWPVATGSALFVLALRRRPPDAA